MGADKPLLPEWRRSCNFQSAELKQALASGSGPRGWWYKSTHPDYSFQPDIPKSSFLASRTAVKIEDPQSLPFLQNSVLLGRFGTKPNLVGRFPPARMFLRVNAYSIRPQQSRRRSAMPRFIFAWSSVVADWGLDDILGDICECKYL